MANVKINSKTYSNVDKVRIPNADGNTFAQFVFDKNISESANLLEYLDTTGSGCVDLGINFRYPTDNYELYLKFAPLATATAIIMGTGYPHTGTISDQLVRLSSNIRMDRVNNTTNYAIAVNDVAEYDELNGTLTMRNLSKQSSFEYSVSNEMININESSSFLLFAEHSGNSYKTFAKVRFYEFAYRENGNDVIHLYPALDENNVKCLWDSVSKEYFYPTASETFA